jgi:hypothetical protein
MRDRKLVLAVNPRLALSKPAWVSACSKKSFSSVRCPILTCRFVKSGSLLAGPPASPKT